MVIRRSRVMVALSGTALSDGVVQAMWDTITEPLPRKGSRGNRPSRAATSWMIGAIA
jgi:hypothetical protein